MHGDASPSVYNLSLLCAFAANVFQLISVSLLFRYSDFIEGIGGNEWHLGVIVGVSSVGAIGIRIFQGSAIDRFGAQWTWYVCLAGQFIALMWHLQIDSMSGPQLLLARTLYATSMAGAFGAWLSFVSLQAPIHRVAEVIGVVGSSGFVGSAIGPAIGDWVFSQAKSGTDGVRLMFVYALVAVVVAGAFSVASCALGRRPDESARRKTNPKIRPWRVIRKAQPGFALVLGALMGMTIGFPGTYLRPMAQSLNIEQINLFFLTYNVTAFICRLAFRRTPQILGLKRTICLGFGFMALSFLLYLMVDSEAKLIWPALAGGVAHSFLFPSVVTACTNRFEIRDRGVATSLILAMYDLGMLIGMPAIGALLLIARHYEWPPYSVVVSLVSAVVFLTIVLYLSSTMRSDHEKSRAQPH